MKAASATRDGRKAAVPGRARTVLTLFSDRDALASHSIRLLLANKGVAFDLELVDASNPPEDLIDLNPTQSLPTLVDRDLVLYEASVVAEYLDERYPHPPLMPADPLSRARIRLGMHRVQHEWYPFVTSIRNGSKSVAETARKHLRESLIASSPIFKASKFFLNTDMTLVDVLLIPLMWRLPSLGVQIPKDAHAINDYADRMFRNPGFMRSLTAQERQLRD